MYFLKWIIYIFIDKKKLFDICPMRILLFENIDEEMGDFSVNILIKCVMVNGAHLIEIQNFLNFFYHIKPTRANMRGCKNF